MAEEVPRSGGVVLRFNDQKGFGFIKPDDGGDDLFVHHSDIKSDGYRTLFPGQSVEFYVLLDDNKTKAVEVTGPNGSPLQQRTSAGPRAVGGGYGGPRGAGGAYGGARAAGGGGGECYTCGRLGHMARDCDGGARVGGGGGRGGGGYGGSRGGGERGGGGYGGARGGGGGVVGGNGVCYNCGGIGHMARDCTSARNAAAAAGGGGGGGGGCYTCGEHGHLARECPIGTGGGGGGGGRGYDRFGGGGGRGYDRFGGGGGGRGGGSCYNCGEPGHYAKDCNTARE